MRSALRADKGIDMQTIVDWRSDMLERAEAAGVTGAVNLTVEAYRAWCGEHGVLPRKEDGGIDNCAVANGGAASDCQVCGGRCPDAVRLFKRACGTTEVTAASLEAREEDEVHEDVAGVGGDDRPEAHGFAHTSDSAEHDTPYDVVGAATRVLGRIDLDPASNALANEYIEAGRYFDRSANGLAQAWWGTVFLNPPGGLCDEEGRPCYPRTKRREGCTATGSCGLPPGHAHRGVTSSAKRWWSKLVTEWNAGRVEAAVFVGFSLEQFMNMQSDLPEGGFSPLDCVVCVPNKRLRYLHEEDGALVVGTAPPHASFIAYIGPKPDKFAREFDRFGRVLVGHQLPESGWVAVKP